MPLKRPYLPRNRLYNCNMPWISKKRLEALTEESKGYYDGLNKRNEYFNSIGQSLQGIDIAPFLEIDRENIKRTYESCAPVYGIVNLIADNVGDVMRYLFLQKDGKDVEEHWLLNLLRRPNDRFSTRKFGQAWAINKLLYGDAWTYAPKSIGKDYGTIKEMYIIPSNNVEIAKGGVKRPMKGIYIEKGDKKTLIPVDDFFESFDYNLNDATFFGTSKIVTAAIYLSVMQRGMRREDTSLKNGGVANIITPAKDNMGVMPQDKDTVEEKFNKPTNVGKTMALRVPVEVHELGSAPVDLGILDSHKEAVTALCFVFKLPVDLYYGQSKYENAKEAKKTVYEQCAIPMANEFAEDLLRFTGLDKEGYTLRVNTDEIYVLKDDPGDVLDNLNKMHATLNEMREAYGYERIEEEWADKPIFGMATMFGNETFDVTEPKE